MLQKCIKSAIAAAWILALVACGGGGGGDAGPGALQLTVELGGTAASPDGAGSYTVHPGRAVAVKANQSVTWSGENLGSGVTRTDTGSDGSLWASRFSHPGAATAGGYQLTARTASGNTQVLKFAVQPTDPASGDYMVFAANGSRQTLSIDFDAAIYTMTDATGVSDSGKLSGPVAPQRDWRFHSSRLSGPNTATTFRRLDDSLVGAFPFAVPFSAPGQYASYPFVAARDLLTTPAGLDGAYDRAGISYAPGGKQSNISQIGISGGGTVMSQCVDLGIYQIQNCPPASVVRSDIVPDPVVANMWQLKEQGTGTVLGRFAVARIGGERIYLSAGVQASDGAQLLRIGVPAALPSPDFSSTGWSTQGTLDVSNASSTLYALSLGATGYSINRSGSTGSPGILVYALGPGESFFSMRSQQLELLVGARSSSRAGFLHIGLVD